jgi:hypothetical protein
MDTPPLTGSRWQLAAASVLVVVWTLILMMMAVRG